MNNELCNSFEGTLEVLQCVVPPSGVSQKLVRGGGVGGTQYKRTYGDMPQTFVAKSASGYVNDPLFYAKFGIGMRKCGVILVKVWPKIGPIGI